MIIYRYPPRPVWYQLADPGRMEGWVGLGEYRSGIQSPNRAYICDNALLAPKSFLPKFCH